MATLPSEPTPESAAPSAAEESDKVNTASPTAKQPPQSSSQPTGDDDDIDGIYVPPGIGKTRVEKTMIESAQDRDTSDVDCYECRACSYVYEPLKGDSRKANPGTSFETLPVNWRCPVCSAPKPQFFNVGPKGTPSGFKDNLNYGFGVNSLTPGQKNILIFGSLLAFFFIFLSLYGMG